MVVSTIRQQYDTASRYARCEDEGLHVGHHRYVLPPPGVKLYLRAAHLPQRAYRGPKPPPIDHHGIESGGETASVVAYSGDLKPQPAPFMGVFQRPHRMRIEWPKDTPIPRIELTDGKIIVQFYPSRRGFCRPDPKLFLQRTPHEAMSALGWSLAYDHITDSLRSARIVGNRELMIGAEAVNCRVVAAIYPPAKSGWTGRTPTAPITYWIHPKTNIVVQQSFQTTITVPGRDRPRTDTTTTTLVRYRLNPKIQDARLTFQPPQRVTERSCLSFSSGG